MSGASKQRIGYKNTNVLRKSLKKEAGVTPDTGEGEEVPRRLGSGGWEAHANTQPNIPGRAQSDAAAARVCRPDWPEGGGAGEPCGRGRAGGWGPRVSLSVPVCGVGLRPEVLKCMSATAGSGKVRAAATAAAVVLKRTAPDWPAAAAATLSRRRRGPAAPARGRRGRGGGRRQSHRRPALLAAAGLGPEPAARAGASTLRTAASPPSPSARRLSGHPRSPLRREKARQPRGLGERRREWAPRPRN